MGEMAEDLIDGTVCSLCGGILRERVRMNCIRMGTL